MNFENLKQKYDDKNQKYYYYFNEKLFTGFTESNEGTILHFKNGLVHREDGCAVIFISGFNQYYLNGKFIEFSSFMSFEEFQLIVRKEKMIIFE